MKRTKVSALLILGALVLTGCATLHSAASSGDVATVNKLLAEGSNINARDNIDLTPLMTAVMKDQVESVRVLVAKGADVNLGGLGSSKFTALMFAANRGKPEIVAILLSGKADPNLTDEFGKTALMFATLRGHAPVVDQLLAAGAKVNMEDTLGGTAAFLAGWTGNETILNALLKRGADPQPALTAAANKGHVKMVDLLLQRGAAVNAVDTKGRIFSGYAWVFGWRTRVVEIFKKRQGTEADTAFFQAASGHHLDVLTLLAERGADVHTKNSHHRTPLMLAALNDRTDIIDFLVSKGVDVNAKDKSGKTALELAQEKNKTAAVAALRKAGAK